MSQLRMNSNWDGNISLSFIHCFCSFFLFLFPSLIFIDTVLRKFFVGEGTEKTSIFVLWLTKRNKKIKDEIIFSLD